jgi:hypothetical protein
MATVILLEDIEILDQAIRTAFPDRADMFLRELARWCWDPVALPPAGAPGVGACAFCKRDPATLRTFEIPGGRVCRYCVLGYAERFAGRAGSGCLPSSTCTWSRWGGRRDRHAINTVVR